jgi:hypothetical protein
MRGPKLGVIGARLVQAKLAVHRQPDLGSVRIFLPVIFPPANRAKPQSAGRIKRFVPATRTAIADFNLSAHIRIDGGRNAADYETRQPIRQLHGFLMSF